VVSAASPELAGCHFMRQVLLKHVAQVKICEVTSISNREVTNAHGKWHQLDSNSLFAIRKFAVGIAGQNAFKFLQYRNDFCATKKLNFTTLTIDAIQADAT
jgi:hypothetical protein